MAHPLGSDTSSQVQGYVAVKKVGVPDFVPDFLIKAGFSRALPKTERIRESRITKRERGIWQRRYWEHLIRDDADLQAHVNYIHFNPVKHGYCIKPVDWPYSSIHLYIRRGWIKSDWAIAIDLDVE
ncbi:REP-associated tyrosine transposase [Aeromonas caviae]